jgi:hypothetical protein
MRVMKATYDMKCVATLFMFKMRKKRGLNRIECGCFEVGMRRD